MKRKYQKLSNYGDTISELAALHSRRMEPERLKCPSGSAKYITFGRLGVRISVTTDQCRSLKQVVKLDC